jgi:hypothetical protein
MLILQNNHIFIINNYQGMLILQNMSCIMKITVGQDAPLTFTNLRSVQHPITNNQLGVHSVPFLWASS